MSPATPWAKREAEIFVANSDFIGSNRRTVFVGDEMLAVQCAAVANEHGLEAVAVVSANELVLAEAERIGLAAVDSRVRSVLDCVADVDFEVLFSVAYQRILPPEVLELADVAVNFHDGVLPTYGGLNVTTWSILNDEREHGVTWHLMDERADRGKILHEVRFAVGADETAFSLNARCYEAGLESFGTVALMVAQRATDGREQVEAGRRMYRRVERPIVFLDPERPAVEIERAVRALDVGPRAFGAVGAVHWLAPGGPLVVAAAHVDEGAGTVGAFDDVDGNLALVTVDGRLVLTDVRTPAGESLDAAALSDRYGVRIGSAVGRPASAVVDALTRADEQLSQWEPTWRGLIAASEPAAPALLDGAGSAWSSVSVPYGSPISRQRATAAVAVWLDAVGQSGPAQVAVTDPAGRERIDDLSLLLLPPLVDLSCAGFADSLPSLSVELEQRLDAALAAGPFLADLLGRDPDLRGRDGAAPIGLHVDVVDLKRLEPSGRSVLEVVHLVGGSLVVRSRLGEAETERIAAQIAAVLDSLVGGATTTAEVHVVSSFDQTITQALNDTGRDIDLAVTLDAAFRRRVELAGDAPALSARGTTLTYRDLGQEVDRVARLLTHAGVQKGHTVGIALDRSTDMVASVLATLSIGAHYLPLDPAYPSERLALMMEDSGAGVAVASRRVGFDVDSVRLVDPNASAADLPPAAPGDHGPDALAYVIYTSGSTGRPKGVELEHRQVTNFFAAMDDVIDAGVNSVWLAATSLSFDISVLELLWTLTRGLHVVVQAESGYGEAAQAPTVRVAPGTMSLFYFAADKAQASTGYRLLLESARWADRHGFEAVWTPERHFHDFGAPYPNPSVVGGALAIATERIGIRAGSVVLPLHSPVRVAEEWAVVDNLSGGRVGLSFASGWQPNDFVLRPEAYATARESLPDLVDTVQRLWRGEAVDLPGHDGALVSVSTQPRPVQAELPTWITSAGSPSSFERAGTVGANILTHLLGQSIDQLSGNIQRYRTARVEAGHVGEGQVTLMLHTFLDADGNVARETARLPLKGYLGTAVGLLKDFASAFPTFQRAGADADEAFRSLTDDEMSQLLDLATERYLTTSGLFGTVDEATAMADAVLSVGVDEIACLIDFGIDDDTVLGSLDLLQHVHEHVRCARSSQVDDAVPESFADLVEDYGVTHFQCTPSLASMLVANPRDRAALARIRHLLVGGEALPVGLATELRTSTTGRLTNMYGPTETTIWSLVHEIDEEPTGSVPIGRPIANTQVHVMGHDGRRLPVGVFGELHIGGEGVARGYRGRPDLNLERFKDLADAGRVYATGDVARVRPDGVVEFGGRTDHQVKIRGHRIELAEVEAVLDRHPNVARSVVVASGDGGATLLAFVVLRKDHGPETNIEAHDLRAFVGEHLPAAMVPSAIGFLDQLPLTPNGKVDRKRLPNTVAPQADATPELAGLDDSEVFVTGIWSKHLGGAPSVTDNFFDIGGHSLLAVQIFRELGATHPGLALTDLFRYPTVRTLAAHLDRLRAGPLSDDRAGGDQTAEESRQGSDRGARRLRARLRAHGDD